jgi:hypothetical protein
VNHLRAWMLCYAGIPKGFTPGQAAIATIGLGNPAIENAIYAQAGLPPPGSSGGAASSAAGAQSPPALVSNKNANQPMGTTPLFNPSFGAAVTTPTTGRSLLG